jgi:hydrogenase maturation protease
MKTLVVGCGNTLRGDDAIGIRVVEELAASSLPAGVETLACQQYTPEMAADLSHYEQVLFVDASTPVAMPASFPGRISLWEVTPTAGVSSTGITHSLDVNSLLTLTQSLYGNAPQAVLITVEAASFDLSESLTPEVEAVIPGLVTLTKAVALGCINS